MVGKVNGHVHYSGPYGVKFHLNLTPHRVLLRLGHAAKALARQMHLVILLVAPKKGDRPMGNFTRVGRVVTM